MSDGIKARRVVQIAMSATSHGCENSNYLLAALCSDGAVFIASATTDWLPMPPIPQPVKESKP